MHGHYPFLFVMNKVSTVYTYTDYIYKPVQEQVRILIIFLAIKVLLTFF